MKFNKNIFMFWLQELAFKNELYRLKVTVKTLSGKETSFLTFTRACLVAGSNLKSILTLHLDHLDSPFAVNLATSGNCNSLNELNTNTLTTTVFFRRPESSPTYVFRFFFLTMNNVNKFFFFKDLTQQLISKKWNVSEKLEKKENQIITKQC